MTAFAPGSSIVRRDVFAGQVWTACPARVVADDGAELTFACWPGVEGVAPVPWIRWITGHGVDSFDLLLDLVVRPDGAYQLEDEDEFAHACRAGVITEAERVAVLAARDEVIDLVERRAGPFAGDLGVWRPDPAWPRPELPPDIESV